MSIVIHVRRIATQAIAAVSVLTADVLPASACVRKRPDLLLSDLILNDSKSLTAILHATQVIGEVTVACSEATARALCRPSQQLSPLLLADERSLLGSSVFRDDRPATVSLSAVLQPASSMSDIQESDSLRLASGGLHRAQRMPAAARQALFAHVASNCSPGAVALLDQSGSAAATLASPITTASATPPVLPGQGNVADHLVDAAARREAAAAVHGEDDTVERGPGSPLLLPASAASPVHRPASFDDVAAVAARIHVPTPHLQRWRSAVMDAASAGHVDALLAALSGESLRPTVSRLAVQAVPATSSALAMPAVHGADGGRARAHDDAITTAAAEREAATSVMLRDETTLPADIAAALVQWHDAEHGATPLHAFCASVTAICDDEALAVGLRALVRAGADVNSPAANGSTPLHWAAGAGALAAVRALLAAGADPSARTYTWRRQVFGRGSGQLPIHWAAESGLRDVVKLLASASLPTVLAQDERGQTPAQVAAKELALSTADELKRLEEMPLTLVRIRLASAVAAPVDAALLRPRPGDANAYASSTHPAAERAIDASQLA